MTTTKKRVTKKSNGTLKASTGTNRLPTSDIEAVETIKPPNFLIMAVTIAGISPYMQNKFSGRKAAGIREKQEKGSAAKNEKGKKAPKDFERDCNEAIHWSQEGWPGIPAASLREAMVSACRVAGYVMTKAKLSFFILPTGFEADDSTPLVEIVGPWDQDVRPVRPQANVMDLASRPLWAPGWTARFDIQYDADQFTQNDVANLLHRAGRQVGIGCGRPSSTNSCGMGFGMFEILDHKPSAKD